MNISTIVVKLAIPSLFIALMSLQNAPSQNPQSRAAVASAPAPRPMAEIAKLPKPAAGTVRVYLVRHAESVGNATRDDPKLTEAEKDKLSEKGAKQAAALATALAAVKPRKILHSPAVRARETAQIVVKALSLPAESIAEMKAFGPIETGTSPDANKTALQLLVEGWRAGVDRKLDGGENLAAICARVKTGLAELHKNAGNDPPFVLTHGEIVISVHAGLDPAKAMQSLLTFRFANTGVLALDVAKDGTSNPIGYFADSR